MIRFQMSNVDDWMNLYCGREIQEVSDWRLFFKNFERSDPRWFEFQGFLSGVTLFFEKNSIALSKFARKEHRYHVLRSQSEQKIRNGESLDKQLEIVQWKSVTVV